MSWSPPAEFEEYRIVRALGAGAMGQVFLAHDTLLDRAVAIKFISAIEIGAGVRERFFTEARAVARLSHPNVVGIHRVGEVRHRPYLVSEYVRGTSLAAIAKPVPWERALRIAMGLARGLGSAHRRGVLHRDIKPANVMLGEDDEAKLLDFGLAKLVGASTASERPAAPPVKPVIAKDIDATVSVANQRPPLTAATNDHGDRRIEVLTVEGAIVGTPLYLAPELWRGEPASRRSDVYALGVVLYELVAGRAPHAGLPLVELGERAMSADAAPVATLAPDLPARFADLIDACISREPADRPESGDALGEALEAVISRAQTTIDGSPYRGLSTFEPEHRALFFGRAEETRAVVERLRTETFVVVAGDSGAGKSSLCRAAVLPAIGEKALAGRRWRVATMLPGARPRASLEAALASREDDEGLLLFVDQLEELLTIADPDEAAEVAERLAELVVATSNVRVLASARSDFLGRLAGLPGLGELVGRALFLLGPLGDRGLRDAIVGPARALGYELESDAMVEMLVASGRRNLPLLQFTLSELWDARDDKARTIPADALVKIGGVAGALARHADQVMAALGDADREIAWRVFVRLTTAEGTRAVLTRAELGEVAGQPAAVERVVERLVAARLLVVAAAGDDRVEVVHEALFTSWPRLAEWRRAHEVDARLRDQLAEAARQWRERDEPRGLLWRDDALVELGLWRKRWGEPLTAVETGFADASAAEARRTRRGRAIAVGLVIAGLSAALVLLYRADRRARAERTDAELQNRMLLVRQGDKELEGGYANRALAYYLEAASRGDLSPANRFSIALAGRPMMRDRGVVVRMPYGFQGWARSPNGAFLATAERGAGTLRVFDGDRRLVFEQATGLDFLTGVAFSPDGRWLVAVGQTATLHVWEVGSWRTHAYPVDDPPDYETGVSSPIAFSADSALAAIPHSDGILRVRELASGRLVFSLGQRPAPDGVPAYPCVAFARDGRMWTTASTGIVTVWDVATWQPVGGTTSGASQFCQMRVIGDRVYLAQQTRLLSWTAPDAPPIEFKGNIEGVGAIEPRGDEIVANSGGTLRRWNARTGELLGELAPSPRRGIGPVRIDPTGRLVVFPHNELFRVWDLESGREVMAVEPALGAGRAHNARAGTFEAAFSPDGRHLLTASGVEIHEWEITTAPLATELAPGDAGTLEARWSPDDKRVVLAGWRPAEIRDRDGALLVTIPLPPQRRAWDVMWSPDGQRVGFVGDAGLARIYHADGRLEHELVGHSKAVNHAQFSPDGTRIVTAGDDRTARVWDVRSGRELVQLAHPQRAMSAVWTADGTRIVTAGYDGWLRMFDAATGTQLFEMGDPTTQYLDLALSPDNTKLAVAGHDNVATIWDVATRTRERSLIGHIGPVTGVTWSPDGALLASSADDGRVRIWDPSDARSLAVFEHAGGGAMSVEWSHDGTRVVAAGGRVTVWDVRRDERSLDELRATRNPWRVVDGKLVGADL